MTESTIPKRRILHKPSKPESDQEPVEVPTSRRAAGDGSKSGATELGDDFDFDFSPGYDDHQIEQITDYYLGVV